VVFEISERTDRHTDTLIAILHEVTIKQVGFGLTEYDFVRQGCVQAQTQGRPTFDHPSCSARFSWPLIPFYKPEKISKDKWSKQFDTRPHRRPTRTVRSYSPGCANVHPSSTPQSASAPYQCCCPLLSHFEYIDHRTCRGMSCAGRFSPS